MMYYMYMYAACGQLADRGDLAGYAWCCWLVANRHAYHMQAYIARMCMGGPGSLYAGRQLPACMNQSQESCWQLLCRMSSHMTGAQEAIPAPQPRSYRPISERVTDCMPAHLTSQSASFSMAV